jgi:hypothetical protein
MKTITIVSTLFAFLLVYCSPLSSDFYADGYVLDKLTKEPISNAEVTLTCNNYEMSNKTNANGYFKISLNIFPDSSDAAVLIIKKDEYSFYSETIYALFSSLPDTFYLEKLK